MLDYLITNAQVYDGLSEEPHFADLGVEGDHIAYFDDAAGVDAHHTVNADGKILCPGFIDVHGSDGLGFILPHAADHKLAQGVTTELVGTSGRSVAPIGKALEADMEQRVRGLGRSFSWRRTGQWLDQVAAYGLPINVATLVGHHTLDRGTAGHAKPREQGSQLLRAAMDEGALGLSLGAESSSQAEELYALASLVAERGGLLASHLRHEREDPSGSLDELIELGRKTGVSVLIHHLRIANPELWGSMSELVRSIESAVAQDAPLHFAVHPYTATSRRLNSFVPDECMAEGIDGLLARLGRSDWRQYTIQWLRYRQVDLERLRLPASPVVADPYRGQSIAQAAVMAAHDPYDLVVDLLLGDPELWVDEMSLSEDDVQSAVLCNESIICSEPWTHPVNASDDDLGGSVHPRAFGAFTRFLEHYALEGLMPFGRAVKKITSLPADALGLKNRGRIEVGAFADLTLIDPNEVREIATPADPRQFSRGTEKVWVNGVLVLDQGAVQAHKPGQILKRC